ncbi:HD-GYP domain, c-di-GMP phosphodiesterase class II (or its inactivated variant) [Andreprevotia lacus DSM 23236]|jgi:HD-GYP domain-containing protein (c-di-GMP phosphodiesterase class II)|uniref:HD-GYP domain, c-di-GMP phosphodiesterase class II (Or its inactivated variant) n=1 Tax=Andreprevotia lacus DSM 23236 TaxID=1121001 RepID=A0A1W1X2D7_9NEIS|nr:HD family phosphohydrolase [Andreprevotia lacus]SMC18065.1 HD-GYP domain, c-di-GMP phosphodiesterase class II (or its inactivated variant) [Andreprevotia lacus DSM 23236]
MDDLREQLAAMLDIGVALSGETDINRLMQRILDAARELVQADAGTLYSVTEDHKLKFEIVITESLGIRLGGTSGAPVHFPLIPLIYEDGAPNHNNVVASAVNQNRTINIDDAYSEAGYDFSGTKRFDAANGYRSQSFLCVPMKNHEGEVIGALQLINAHDANGRVIGFTSEHQHLVESLASQAAIALTNRQLIHSLEQLFEAFIGLINLAIDDKSPYTGGHCQRVPELTMLIADAADRAREGPLADFRMTERDRYELKIAGLLHDCGKVTTPVHVVDKATKLQTIFDRIELIDTRFEVLKREAEIACLKGALADSDYQQLLAELDDERSFLRQINVGGEFLRDEAVERVRTIAKRSWRGPDGQPRPLLTEDEIENLCIRKGTLTDAERQIINHHIEVTIQMLEALPWPKHLTRVPEYAGGHHERMDGKGYPRGLKREQMSVQARMMGIADIFEALTARDRPYKEGMKLSQALTILARMCKDQHIDPDLFDVFVRQNVWKDYADLFLNPAQIDAVDIEPVLAIARGD